VPGYEYFKSVSESMLGADKHARYPVVLVSVGSAWQFGLKWTPFAGPRGLGLKV